MLARLQVSSQAVRIEVTRSPASFPNAYRARPVLFAVWRVSAEFEHRPEVRASRNHAGF